MARLIGQGARSAGWPRRRARPGRRPIAPAATQTAARAGRDDRPGEAEDAAGEVRPAGRVRQRRRDDVLEGRPTDATAFPGALPRRQGNPGPTDRPRQAVSSSAWGSSRTGPVENPLLLASLP